MNIAQKQTRFSVCRRLAGGLFLALTISGLPALAGEQPGQAEEVSVSMVLDAQEYRSASDRRPAPAAQEAPGSEDGADYSAFVTRVLKEAYNWNDNDIRAWLGSSSPNAARYHDAIVERKGFLAARGIADIQAGDIIAVKHAAGGQVMLVVGPATRRSAPAPVANGTRQYEVAVLDPRAAERNAEARGNRDPEWNAGVGLVRLYVNAGGEIVGYSLGTAGTPAVHDQASRHLVVGKLIR